MKKIFTILGVILLSMAVHATVITRDLDWVLSGSVDNVFTVNAWEWADKWEWTSDVDDYDQLVVEVADHAYPIVVTVTCTDGTSDFSAKNIMLAGTNSVEVNLTGSILKGVTVTNYSGNDAVTITVTRIYLRGVVAPAKELTLWSGSMHFDDYADWGSEIHLEPSVFADVHEGDMLEINYSLDEDTYYQFKIETPYYHNYPAFLGTLDTYNQYNISKDVTPSSLTFTIMSSTDITNLKNDGGLYINAKHLTVTSVKLIKHEVLWTGSQAIGNWSNELDDIAASKLTGLQVGNILCVRVAAIGTEDAPRVNLAYGGSWNSFSPAVEYYFQGGDVAPMLVEFPVTYKMEQQLRGNKLVIRGVNYTVTDVFVKSGTPVTNVAEYLTVSAAGMATYLLPFDVPALPAGVEAYNLTYSGEGTIMAARVNALTADEPVLIVANEGEYEFVSEAGASNDISAKTGTYTNGALIGTYTLIDPLEQTTAGYYNYVLNNQGGNVAFYQVKDDGCSVAPYRAYLNCAYDASDNGANFAPKMRIIFPHNSSTAIDEALAPAASTKIMRDGQLLILKDSKVYNVLGQLQ